VADEEPINWKEAAQELGRGFTRGILRSIADWFRGRDQEASKSSDPGRGILILGPGGTGKTTFARLLSGDLDWLSDTPGQYIESVGLESFALSDDPNVEVVVAPGQAYRRASTWSDLLKQVAAGEYRGVVLMNAYGYHTFSTPSYKNHQLYQGSKDDFLRDYYADRRADEIRVLKQLAPHLSICSKRVWLLSIVAKQDLWGSQQRQVEEHYVRGDYATEIHDIAQKLGHQLFRPEVVFLSLIIRNLETIANERLQATEEGYDMRRVLDSLRTLITVVAGLKHWEDER
jgi:energy-coupling factor transporter ATP-binding protein EcfA2